MAGATFEIEISSTVEEEKDWANTTRVKVILKKPSCQVSQSDIDMIAVSVPDINLHATKNLAPYSYDMTDLLEKVNKAFETGTGELSPCGLIDYLLLLDGNTD